MSGKGEGRHTTLPFVSNAEQLSKYLFLSDTLKHDIQKISEKFPLKIPEFYLSLMDHGNPGCPLRKQSVPSKDELVRSGSVDPLEEQSFLITPSFIKKYPKRGVFLATSTCAMYCRFCNRRRFVGKNWDLRLTWEESFRYIERDNDVQEVIVSGGDPCTLSGKDFMYMMRSLRRMKRIQVIRVSTRLPVVNPGEFNHNHYTTLKRFAPIWVVIHINHPREVSPEFIQVVKRLKDAGTSIVSQTVLLRGVNDCPYILLNLFELLVVHGIKPYYLFQLDEVQGAMHFKVSVQEGIQIMHFLRKNGSGLALPQYALDITGGYGKVPLDYQYLKKQKGRLLHLESPSGEEGFYVDNGKKSRCQDCNICGQKRQKQRS